MRAPHVKEQENRQAMFSKMLARRIVILKLCIYATYSEGAVYCALGGLCGKVVCGGLLCIAAYMRYNIVGL